MRAPFAASSSQCYGGSRLRNLRRVCICCSPGCECTQWSQSWLQRRRRMRTRSIGCDAPAASFVRLATDVSMRCYCAALQFRLGRSCSVAAHCAELRRTAEAEHTAAKRQKMAATIEDATAVGSTSSSSSSSSIDTLYSSSILPSLARYFTDYPIRVDVHPMKGRYVVAKSADAGTRMKRRHNIGTCGSFADLPVAVCV
jgi:hypothetical protein